MIILTVSPGSPVPVILGLRELVIVITGGVISRVNGTIVVGDIFHAGSVATTLILFGHSTSAGDISHAQFQLPSTTTVQVSPSGPVTVIVSHGIPVPVTVGVASLSSIPSVGEVTIGATGIVVSIVTGREGDGSEVFPARSVSV